MIPDEIIQLAKQRWPEITGGTTVYEASALNVDLPTLKPVGEPFNQDWSWSFLKADATLHPENYTLEQKMEIAEKTSIFNQKRVTLELITDGWAAGYIPELDKLFVAETEKDAYGEWGIKRNS